jgi:hypothetical protein
MSLLETLQSLTAEAKARPIPEPEPELPVEQRAPLVVADFDKEMREAANRGCDYNAHGYYFKPSEVDCIKKLFDEYLKGEGVCYSLQTINHTAIDEWDDETTHLLVQTSWKKIPVGSYCDVCDKKHE